MPKPAQDDSPAPEPMPRRTSRVLAVLAVLGIASSLWALFLWQQLLEARAGGTPFCGFGESADCGDLWSAAFATTIHRTTGLPIAGWGLVWGIVASILPLAALAYRDDERRRAMLGSAIYLTALGGVAGLAVLLTASATEGLFCSSCALTYALTAIYAATTFVALRRPVPDSPHGVTIAVAATGVAFLLLLYPGSKTPQSTAEVGRQALAEATQTVANQQVATQDGSAATESTGSSDAAPPPATDRAAVLRRFIADLPPPARQGLADSLYIYRDAPDLDAEEPREVTLGSGPLRITEFTDVLCSHCASLHQTMAYLSTVAATDFSLDSRQFPLDGNCNSKLEVRGPESVRCMAARALICVGERGFGFDFAGALFHLQEDLTAEKVFELAAPMVSRAALSECLANPATADKLVEDVEYAWRHEPDGTPLVLINGRRGTSFGPFLYAMILSGGDGDHPAFANLPAPNTEAHMH